MTNAVRVSKAASVWNFGVVQWMVCILVALSASCSSSNSDEVRPLDASGLAAASSTAIPASTVAPATSTTATVTTTTSESPWTDEQLEVIDAFEAAEVAFRRFAVGDRVELTKFFAAEAAQDAMNLVESRASDGHRLTWSDGADVAASYLRVDVGNESAFLRGCFVDDAVVRAIDSGVVVDDDVVFRSFEASLSDDGGRWLVSGLSFVGEVAQPC